MNEWTALNIGLHRCVCQWSLKVDRLETFRFACRLEQHISRPRTSGGSPCGAAPGIDYSTRYLARKSSPNCIQPAVKLSEHGRVMNNSFKAVPATIPRNKRIQTFPSASSNISAICVSHHARENKSFELDLSLCYALKVGSALIADINEKTFARRK